MIKRGGIHSSGLLFLVFISVGSAWAQGVRGFYLSHDIGLNVAPKVVLRGTTSDRASVCDEFINPLYAAVGGCTSPNRGAGDGWSTAFKRALGGSSVAQRSAIDLQTASASRSGTRTGNRPTIRT